jgi:hypothetical protein
MSPLLEVQRYVAQVGGTVEDAHWGGRHGRVRWRLGARQWIETVPMAPRHKDGLRWTRAQIQKRARVAA